MEFKVLLNDHLANLTEDDSLSSYDNKLVLSLINDYEDGRWRFERFQNYVWDYIAESALSLREREALANKSHTKLVRAAQNLRLTDDPNDPSEGSELAEIVLYGILREYYSALSVVPKIFYKQNTQDVAKGADSVHIVLGEGEEDFTLWFGEAKFYTSISDARLPTIARSVKNGLRTDKLRKENSIITNVNDLDCLDLPEELTKKIKDTLDYRTSIDDIKPRLNVPIFLLHQCETTKQYSENSAELDSVLLAHHIDRASSYFSTQARLLSEVNRYALITFHLILFPIPDKAQIVETFLSKAKHFRGE